jgi:uncharacterized protein (DUF952 family)
MASGASGAEMTTLQTPEFLYKVTSVQDWQKSQTWGKLVLSKDDTLFIHLSTERELERITGKYWSSVPEYVILKLASLKLQGRLVFEANPGRENKYYHLYEGAIPLDAVVEVKWVKSPSLKPQ